MPQQELNLFQLDTAAVAQLRAGSLQISKVLKAPAGLEHIAPHLETDKKILLQRVSVAEAAVIARRRKIFYADGTAEEKEALEDVLYALHAFKTAWQHSDAA